MKYTFLILGDSRSGTTSIWTYFNHHTQITSSKIKEMLHRIPEDETLKTYVRDGFATTRKTKVLLEGSPNLIGFKPKHIDQIKIIPEVKSVRCLYTIRKPIEKFISTTHLYMINYQRGRFDIPYFLTRDMKIDSDALFYFFLTECLAFRKIRLMEKKIGRDNLMVMRLNSLASNLDKVFQFLGVDNEPIYFGALNKKVDHAPDVNHLRVRLQIIKWSEDHKDFINYHTDLDNKRIQKRYGEIW
jgi:hypothetical protein